MSGISTIFSHPIRVASSNVRVGLLATASLMALTFGGQAALAAAPMVETPTAEEADVEAIVVTGSRIVRDGYTAPTPVTVLGVEEIQALAPANLADFVNTLPSIAGSTTPASSSPNLSQGLAGVNAINLRNLGVNRTLVLVDGQRSVASSAGGVVDINTIPQSLVQRVDIVTGGASAAYGSDAVGGVINFILNKDFDDITVKAEYGETTYGDGANYKYSAAAGHKFLDNRLHLMGAAEYSRTEGIHDVPRDWNSRGYFNMKNPAYAPGNGQPENSVGYNTGPAQLTPGGLITAGPLKGTYFGTLNPATGQPTINQLAYGPNLGQWMRGGDWEYTGKDYFGSESLLPGEMRWGLFGRASYDINENITVFAQGSYNRAINLNYYIKTTNIANVNIRTDNAFIPAALRSQIQAAYPGATATFQMGTTNSDWAVGGANNTRNVYRFVAGANGRFDLMAKPWTWDFYVQRGQTKTHEMLINTYNTGRLALAQDAVFAPAGNTAGVAAGTIVCRSTLTSPTNGCVPINRMGVGVASQAALDYIFYDNPYRDQKLTQTVGALTFSGPVFTLPAGEVSMAVGGEWRKEAITGYVPPEFGPVGTAIPGGPTGCKATDGLLIPNCTSGGWLYGNYVANIGSYTVAETFAEIDIPVFTGFNVNAAGRYTDYSTSGSVQTWKLGATYQVVEDVMLRGTLSHDIRAPNLGELFAGGTARTNTVLINNRSYAYVQNATGNPDLTPEIADGYNVGIVLTPRFMPRFSMAVDYYKISITDAIGQLTPQQTADLCYLQGVTSQCANLVGTFEPNGQPIALTRINLKPFNFTEAQTRGMDFEATYRLELADMFESLPGSLTLRGMATHYMENSTADGIGFPVDEAGSSTLPDWIYRATATYRNGPWSYNMTARGVSGTTLSNNYVECTTACPLSTAEFQTINDNSVPGATFFDLAVGWDFEALGTNGTWQLSIRNLFDKDPPNVGNLTSSASTAAFPQSTRYFDQLGRVYKLSVELTF
jgi:iron complex outermembrane recepter protein